VCARADDYLNKWNQGGHPDMWRYRKTGSGLHLYRAYTKRRKADAEIVKARREKLASKLEGNLSSWKPSDGPDSLTAWQVKDGYIPELAELLMLDILDSLDPVIEELLRFCESRRTSALSPQPAPGQLLSKLRKALRIDARRSPAKAMQLMRKNHSIYLFYSSYLAMNSEDDPTFKSERAIAREIERKTGINWRSAVRHWKQAKHDNLAFAHLAREASARAARLGAATSAIKSSTSSPRRAP